MCAIRVYVWTHRENVILFYFSSRQCLCGAEWCRADAECDICVTYKRTSISITFNMNFHFVLWISTLAFSFFSVRIVVYVWMDTRFAPTTFHFHLIVCSVQKKKSYIFVFFRFICAFCSVSGCLWWWCLVYRTFAVPHIRNTTLLYSFWVIFVILLALDCFATLSHLARNRQNKNNFFWSKITHRTLVDGIELTVSDFHHQNTPNLNHFYMMMRCVVVVFLCFSLYMW